MALPRKLVKSLRAGERILPKSVTRQARLAASQQRESGLTSPSDVRADLEERVIRQAVSNFERRSAQGHDFNRDAVETRVKGGVFDGETGYPMARIERGIIVKSDGSRVRPVKKPSRVRPASDTWLRNHVSMTGDEWRDKARREARRKENGKKYSYREFYH